MPLRDELPSGGAEATVTYEQVRERPQVLDVGQSTAWVVLDESTFLTLAPDTVLVYEGWRSGRVNRSSRLRKHKVLICARMLFSKRQYSGPIPTQIPARTHSPLWDAQYHTPTS